MGVLALVSAHARPPIDTSRKFLEKKLISDPQRREREREREIERKNAVNYCH
jgi:hypothetical protein